MSRFATVLAASLLSASVVQAATYSVKDTFVGPSFLTGFTAQAIADPTNGRVNYVSQAQAKSLNLTYTSSDTFILRADDTTTLTPSGPGRNSVRLQSNKLYDTSLLVADIRWMPQGCGTWPALWSFGTNWPYDGEIDIIEGVNDQGPDASTLHTSPGCTLPSSISGQTGTLVSTDCNTADNGNQGCQVKSTNSNSYGPSFNNNGGGWYAMERTSTYIKVWFWPRNSANVPAGVKNGGSNLNTANFGTPFANFVNTDCDISSHFGPHHIIINLTFCGDWAGQQSLYAAAGCPGTCVDYVNNHPAAFKNAYWDFAALRMYE
ncbi:hypothetical protein DL93DRAFT_110943 [Clavulina sp. PMI_390]|nr:hypothetical protein DL93DRAFT_110943 [Clavulina sp. PMI_390]